MILAAGAVLLANARNSPAQGPTWGVRIEPQAQAQSSPLTVTIFWCDKTYQLSSGTRNITFKGQNVTSQFTYTNLGYGLHDCAYFFSGTPAHGGKAVGSVTLTPGQIDTLKASMHNVNGTLLSGTRTYTLGMVTTVAVTPHGGTATPPPNAVGLTQPFVVTNHGNISAAFALQVVSCNGAVYQCSAPSSVTVGANGGQATVNVTYRTLSAGKGTIELRASKDAVTDVGTVYATTTPTSQANTRLLVNEVNPGVTIDRASCLVFGIVRDVASECGALRVTHALPSVRTLNKVRTPTLVYYSDQVHPPVLAAHVILADTATIPDSVQVNVQEVLSDNSLIPLQSRTYAGSAWGQNRQQRVSISISPSDFTRILKYQAEVKLRYGAEWRPVTPIVTGELAIVTRLKSRFGAGWWLAGVEQLFFGHPDGAILWVGGDGSTRKYARKGTLGTDSVFVADTLTRPDTLFREASGVYRRSLPGRLRVYFDASGRHTRTANRLDHETRFVWGAVGGEPRLDTIVVPTPAGVRRAYDFVYVGDSLRLIRAPGNPTTNPREVRLTRVNVGDRRGVDSIVGPDTTRVSFQFQSWGADYAYGARIDRRGNRTVFQNEPYAPTIAYAWTLVGATDTVRHDFRTVGGIGAAPTAGPVRVDSAYFRYDGPRTDVADITKVWTDRFGAPTTIVNALGHTTVVRRDDWRFPGLVTRIEYPQLAGGQQRVQTATFDWRGNVKTTVEWKPYVAIGNNRDAVTRFEYDNSTWPTFVTRIVPPERDSIVIDYFFANGNRMWQRDARGDSTKVFFYYANDWKLLSAVVLPGGAKDSVRYTSPLGNMDWRRTPKEEVTIFEQDALGRDTLTKVPINAAQSLFRFQATVFDANDRAVLITSTGEAINGVAQQSLHLENDYDPEGNLTRASRWSTPDLPTAGGIWTPIGTITTRWDYDGLNRRSREYAPDGTPTNPTDNPYDEFRYDAAGNLDTLVTRRGHVVAMSYDALNRLIVKRVDSAQYAASYGVIQNPEAASFAPSTTGGIERTHAYPRYPNDATNNPGGYTVARDSALFSYDELGNLLRADNRDARISRGYFLNGLLRVDTLRIRTVAELSAGGDIESTHRYVLGYRYDLNGRRTELHHPNQLAPSATQNVTRYAYDVSSSLSSLTDVLGYQYKYWYNRRSELRSWELVNRPGTYGGHGYDADGHLAGDTVADAGTFLRRTQFTYFPGGQLKDANNTSGNKDITWALYSGLGHLVDGAMDSEGTATSYPAGEGRRFELDAFGNVHRGRHGSYYVQGTSCCGGWVDTHRGYEAGTGRLAWQEHDPSDSDRRRDTTYYDAAGNTAFETSVKINSPEPTGGIRDRVHFYGRDGALRATESRSHSYGGEVGAFRATFEEYRYDALGRRVLVHTRRYCTGPISSPPPFCNLGWVRRTVWDGQSELYEIQMPLDTGYINKDTNTVSLAVQSGAGSYFDPNSSFGRVLYTHGMGIDRPQSIIRMGYVRGLDETFVYPLATPVKFSPFAITPFWDARGQPELGIFSDIGQTPRCQTVNGKSYCVRLFWPGKYLAYEWSNLTTDYWHGTLLDNKGDASGLHYRRNRYYDPISGRFTQEDPIGTAGGMNLYGYADGDPVNQHDPFGLACEKRSGDRMVCTNIGPGDAEAIRDFLGGESGRSAYATLRSNPAFRSENCQGGFGSGQCMQLANTSSRLINHNNSLCSDLGTGFVRTWQAGRVSYKSGPRSYGGAGFLFGPLGRIWMPQGTLEASETFLQNTVAHEAAHLKWPWTQLLHLRPRERDDRVYQAGRTCQQ